MVKPVQLGHVNIRVRDLKRAERFYTEVLGLGVTHRRGGIVFLSGTELSHEIAFNPLGEDAAGPDESRIGLNHMAWQMGPFEDLQAIYRHLGEQGVEVLRVRENTFSMGIYFTDPDGNGIEVYYEAPGMPWRQAWEGTYPREMEEAAASEGDADGLDV